MRGLFKIMCSGILAIIILSGFVLVYGYAGIHINNDEAYTDYLWLPWTIRTTMIEGIAWNRMDSYGLNNAKQIKDIDLVVLGSSHVDNVHIMAKDNLCYLLNDNDVGTLNSAITGHTIYRCVDNYKSAISKFAPSKYSLIETASVKLSTDEMQLVIDKQATRIPSYDSGAIYYLQFIPVFRAVYNQLSSWATLKSPAGGGTAQLETTLPEGYTDTLHSFLSIVSDTAKENGITPIIFYHPSEQLNSDGMVKYKTDALYLECFASTCEDLGIVFVDMTETFKNLYANEHQLAHGFINTAVGSGHLNKYGHRVIAEKLTEVIQGLEAE